MPRKLDAPREVQRPAAPIVTAQHFDKALLEWSLQENSTAMNPAGAFITVHVVEVDDSGTYRGRVKQTFPVASLPAPVRAAITALRQALMIHGADLGMLEAGVDEGEIDV